LLFTPEDGGMVERQWESADGWLKVAQIILFWRRVNDMLTKVHGRWSRCHLGVNKMLNKVCQRYYWLQTRNDVEKWCQQCDTSAARHGL
jgi:hypothetical protein